MELQRKVLTSLVTTPVSKLVIRFKTGHILATSRLQIQAVFKTGQKLVRKLVIPHVTPVTQITESLPTRRTMWYNGWYNNHLRES